MNCATDHKHAQTGTCYAIHKCRCDDCRAAMTQRARIRERAKLYGRYDHGLTDAEPARAHLRMLMDAGMGWKRISEVSGVGYTAISSLIYGRKGSHKDPRKGETVKRITRSKAEKILAVTPSIELFRPGALVSSRGAIRRIQALGTLGWSPSRLATMLGKTKTNLHTSLRCEQITAGLHTAIADLYEGLWNTKPIAANSHELGGINRTLNNARRFGWVAPLGWDDIDSDEEPPTIDDVDDLIDVVAIDLVVSGSRIKLSAAERREGVTRLHALRYSDRAIAQVLGCDERTVLRDRTVLDLKAFPFSELRGAA